MESITVKLQKVLFFANTSLIGGAEKNILDLAANLDRKYFLPYIAALEPGGPLLEYAHDRGIPVFNPLLKKYFWPTYVFRIIKFFKKNEFDVILVYGLKLKIIVLTIAYFLKIPLRISMIMGMDFWKTPLHLFLEKKIEKFTSIWIANSMAAKKNAILLERKPDNFIKVIYNGLEIDSCLKSIDKKCKKEYNKFKIITVANIKEGKGHLFFLQAIKKLIADKIDIHIEFVGNDYTSGEIQETIENLGLQKVVIIKGFIKDVRSYIRNFDLMVLPSASESLPTSIIECMLEGIPVIATNVGGIPELIEPDRTGWLVPYCDVNKLVDTIYYVINNPKKRAKVAKNARKFASDNFNIYKIVKQYESVFKKHNKQSGQNNKTVKILRAQSRIVVGGPAVHTFLLSKEFNNENFKTILVGGSSKSIEKSLIDRANKNNIKCIVIPEMAREIHFYDDLISVAKFYRLIHQVRPLILHTHTAKAGAIGRLAAFLAGVPIIYHTFHGHVFHSYFGPWKSIIFILFEKILARISTKVIVISENQYQDIVQKYQIAPVEKTKIVPLGFDWDNFFKNSPGININSKYKIPTKKYRIGIVGRLVHIKDHKFFVEIAEKLLQKHPELFHFLIIGDGELRSDIEKLVAEKNMSSEFTFTGWIDVSKELYKCIDVLLLTSKNEGTPVSVIESLVSGTPVVARDVGGVYDIMKHYNLDYLIEERDSDKFIDKILKIVFNKEKVSRSTQNLLSKKYSADRLVNDIKNLYINDLERKFMHGGK